jgi:hypothetical protein
VLTEVHSGEVVSRVAQATPAGLLRARVSDGDFHVRVEGR